MGGGLVCRVQSSPSLGCAALRRFATCAKPTLLFAAVWLRYGVASPHWKTVRVRFCGSWVAFQVPNPSSRAAKRVVACCMSLSTYDSCLGLDISCESSVPRSLAVLVVWRWPETLLMTLAAGFRCNFYSHFFPSATLLSACLHGVDPARCRRHVAWRSPCLLACRPGGWEARHCGPRFCSRFLLLSGAAARQAERTLEYDLEGRLLHLSHAEARAWDAVDALRALIQLPFLRTGCRGPLAHLIAARRVNQARPSPESCSRALLRLLRYLSS